MPPSPSRKDTWDVPRRQPNDGAGRPFWETKTLEQLTPEEWESLCDRCGRCCLVKLEDEDTGEIYRTDIACRMFDAGTCGCVAYAKRQRKVADCVKLTPQSVRAIKWLPVTCAYRLLRDGEPLPGWHPLVSGRPESVHEAGASVRGRVAGSERTIKLRDYADHIVHWDE
jgi:uncharacterized protein